MNPPCVSVLLPAYNRAAYVGEAIQSILDQTFSDLEVVVVDDGSTDNTAEVVQQYHDPRVVLIRQENRGICGALNTAHRAARGRYVALQNSDDIWLPELLSVEVGILESNPEIGLVYPRSQAMDAEGRPMAQTLGAPGKYPGEPLKSLLYGDHVCGLGAVWRRECVEHVGLWDESLVANEDWDMWVRLAVVCDFYFLDSILARYRVHPGNITGRTSEHLARLLADRIRVLDKAFARPDIPPDVQAIRPVAYRNVHMDVGLRWLNFGNRREGLRCFATAVRVSPSPITLLRIAYLVLYYNFLSKHAWGAGLVSRLVDWRRRHRI